MYVILNSIINKLDLKDLYRTLTPTTRKYTFFSRTKRSFIKIDFMLCIKQASII